MNKILPPQAALAKVDGRREKLVETGTLDLGVALAEAPVAPVSLVMHTAGELKLPLTTMDDDDFSDDEVTNGPVAWLGCHRSNDSVRTNRVAVGLFSGRGGGGCGSKSVAAPQA